MKWIITIESDERMSIEAWKELRSRVDFVLARHCPDAHTYLDVKDRKCPRQEKAVRGRRHDMIIIDDPHQPTPDARRKAVEWMERHFPRLGQRIAWIFPGDTTRYYRVIRPIRVGEVAVLDVNVSDRVYPDIEQMLLDCPQPVR